MSFDQFIRSFPQRKYKIENYPYKVTYINNYCFEFNRTFPKSSDEKINIELVTFNKISYVIDINHYYFQARRQSRHAIDYVQSRVFTKEKNYCSSLRARK